MRQLIVSFLLCLAFLSPSQAGERPEAGRYINAYSGGEGVLVWLLRVGPLGLDAAWPGA